MRPCHRTTPESIAHNLMHGSYNITSTDKEPRGQARARRAAQVGRQTSSHQLESESVSARAIRPQFFAGESLTF